MSASPPRLAFRSDLQGLRALAVAIVVLAHAGIPGFEGGYVGVDVFFVLSGFLITGLLLEEHRATGTIAYGRFLSKRLRRLLPALWVMLVVVLVVAWAVLSAYEARVQTRSFPYAVTWMSNLFFAFAQRNYFDALEARDLFLHTWSLGVEEQFYIVWPWLIVAILGWSRGKDVWTAQKFFGVVFALSLTLCVVLSATNPILSFYMMPARGWQFALGAFTYVSLRSPLVSKWNALESVAVERNALILGAVGLLMVLVCPPVLQDTTTYPGAYALLPSIGATAMIAAGSLRPRGLVPNLLSSRPLVWIGDRSYSIYLWHWPVFKLGSVLSWARSWTGIAVLLAVTILLSAISYRFVELPFWKGVFRGTRPRQIVLYSALAVIAAISINSYFNVAADNVVAQGGYVARADWPREIYGPEKNCDTTTSSAEVIPCEIGHGLGGRLAIIWGDSIGVQWAPLLRRIYPEPDWRVIVLTKSACPILDLSYYYDIVGGDFKICTQWRDNVLLYIDDMSPDVLVIGSSAYYEFTDKQWTEASARMFNRISHIPGQVVVIPGTPQLSFDGPACLDHPERFAIRIGQASGHCAEPMNDPQSDLVSQHLARAADGYSNVEILDLGDLVCPDRRCAAATDDGIPVFRDAGHLTVRFVETLLPDVLRRMEKLGIAP